MMDVTISVKDFGAVGDGVADDTVAIQRALNHAHTRRLAAITFPHGAYRVTSPLLAPPDAHNDSGPTED